MSSQQTLPLRVAVIGLGIGEQHIAGFQRSAGCRVTTLCDISAAKLATAKTKYPGLELVSDPNSVFVRPDIDVVSIASFDEAHFDQVMLALKHGKHVFVEKPLCRSVKEAAAIKKSLMKHKGRVKLASNLVLRSAPLYQWLKEQIASGFFGDVYALDADYLYGRFEKITQGWRKKTPNYSVMQGGGIHLIDLMLWMTAQRPSRVFALGNRICSEGTAFRYNDYMAATMRFSSSLIARVTANFGCVHRHHHTMRIFGTRRTFIYDDAGARIHMTSDPQQRAEPVNLAPLPASKGELIAGFVSAIRNKKNISAETQMFFDGINIANACDRSVQSKKEESIKYL